MKGTLHTDGISLGEPGPAGIGFSLETDEGTGYRAGAFIGETTRSVASYNAIIWGLENARAAGVRELEVTSADESLVLQLTGVERVRNEGLKPLFAQARTLLGTFGEVSLELGSPDMDGGARASAEDAASRRLTVGEYLRRPTQKQALPNLTSVPDGVQQGPGHASDAAGSGHPAPLVEDAAQSSSAAPSSAPRSTERRREPVDLYELTVREHFDAAHALRGYPGQCRDLHGHTWDVEVSVAGTELDDIGILYDFKKLKDDLRTILDAYDHAYLNEVKPFDEMNSTAENLARVIYERLDERLPEQVHLTEVCVWESPVARLRFRRVMQRDHRS
ncbi:MAG: 6-carboxytetrahydropterin synthase QueD [Coriobacteriales bacterium]|nr:6-carboxytetrahydropterin synthase QueD [Coriobacteriales bacterium]